MDAMGNAQPHVTSSLLELRWNSRLIKTLCVAVKSKNRRDCRWGKNARVPIDTSLAGIATSTAFTHPEKALAPIVSECWLVHHA